MRHSMVSLGLGQAIIGGLDDSSNEQKKIYFINCFNRDCILTTLSKELSDPLFGFVAIPIPDITAACISKGNMFNLRMKVSSNVFEIWYFHFILIQRLQIPLTYWRRLLPR